jgi:hypothetical protein
MNDLTNFNNQNMGIVYTISKPAPKANVWYGDSDEYFGVDRALLNMGSINTIEKMSKFKNKSENKNENENSEYSNYNNDYTVDSKDCSEFDEDKEEKKLFQWPHNNMPQLYSNDTISIDIDDDKVVGILV